MYITGPINSLSFKIRQVVLDIYPSPFPSTTLRYYRLSLYLSSLLATTAMPPVRLRLATRNHCQSFACVCVYLVCTCVCNKSTFVTKRGQGNSILLCITSSGCETGCRYMDDDNGGDDSGGGGGSGEERVPV